MNKNRAPIKKGFTLVELLVVISIISMLSSVALVALSGARAKGTMAAGQNFDRHTYSAFYDDLILSWDFDTDVPSSGSVADVSGNGNGMAYTLTTGPSTIQRAFNTGNSFRMIPGAAAQTGSIIFNPSPTIVSANMNNVPTGDFSISFWLYPMDVSVSTDYLYAFSGTNDKSWRFSYTLGGTGFGFVYRMAGSTKIASVVSLSLNAWHHIVAVCNNTTIGTYIDGKLMVTTALQSPGTCGGFLNTIPLEIGKNTSLPFYIDNLRIYKKALPLAVIYQEYLAQLPKFQSLARNMELPRHKP